MSDLSYKLLSNLYTSHGGVVHLNPQTGQLLHRPAGVAVMNLLCVEQDDKEHFFERQTFGARPLLIERHCADRLRARPALDHHGAIASIEVNQTSLGRVTLQLDGGFLFAAPTGEIILVPAPHPEFSSFWALAHGSAFHAPVATLRRDRDGDATTASLLPNLNFPQIEQLLTTLVRSGHHGAALRLMFHTVDTHYTLSPFDGRSLFVPGLDSILFELSDALLSKAGTTFAPARTGTRLIVASELYLSGGHSRVVEDLARLPGRVKIVITDCFGNFATRRLGLDFLVQRLPDAEIVVIANADLERKAHLLLTAVAQFGPSEIFLLGHHQDPVPSAVLSSGQIPYRRIFIHHTDHNISLGATCDAYEHVHVTRYVARVVEMVRGIETKYLPLCVDDLGFKSDLESIGTIHSTVTSGSNVKFTRSGVLPYVDIVRAILSAIPGDHFHIGALSEDWVEEIRQSLDGAGIDSRRFRYVGVVPSLWRALLAIDAQIYVTSAPVGGGRAAIEAQGAGFPILFYSGADKSILTQVDEVYADKGLYWKDVDDLRRLLIDARLDIPALARQARAFYKESFSSDAFAERVEQLAGNRST